MRIVYYILSIMLIVACLDAEEGFIKIEESKKTDIKQLIAMDGQAESTKQAFTEIFQTFTKKSSQIPSTVLDEILAEINMDQLLEELIPIYDKYLSHQEVKDLLGVKKLPPADALALKAKYRQQKIKITVIWGHKIATKIQQKLWDKNINFDMYDELDDYDESAQDPGSSRPQNHHGKTFYHRDTEAPRTLG